MDRKETTIKKKLVPFEQGTIFDISVTLRDNNLTYLRFEEDESEDGRGIELSPQELRPIANALLQIAEDMENDPASELYKTMYLGSDIVVKKA